MDQGRSQSRDQKSELYGRALVVIAAEQHASRLVVPQSQQLSPMRWSSHRDHARKALAKIAGPHLPASLKQLEKAIAKAHAEHEKATSRPSRGHASGTGDPADGEAAGVESELEGTEEDAAEGLDDELYELSDAAGVVGSDEPSTRTLTPAANITTSPQNVQDACSFAWMQLVIHGAELENPVGWLYTVATREALKLHRLSQRTVPVPVNGHGESVGLPDPTDRITAREQLIDAREAMRAAGLTSNAKLPLLHVSPQRLNYRLTISTQTVTNLGGRRASHPRAIS